MWRRALIFVAAMVTSASAWAAPQLEIVSTPGVSFRSANVEAREEGLSISGAVCRDGFSGGRPRFIRVDHVDAAGATIDTRWVPLRSSPGYRGGCSSYSIASTMLGEGERARLSAHRARR